MKERKQKNEESKNKFWKVQLNSNKKIKMSSKKKVLSLTERNSSQKYTFGF